MDKNDNNTDQIQSVARAFDIISVLEQEGGMTMSEVAESLDIPNSTAHIYLTTLQQVGYLIRDDQEYQLGLRFLKHGGYVRHRLQIYQAAKSEVDTLARQTGEVVDFGVEENGKRVLVYKSEGPDVVTKKPVTGDYLHMHMTALGKAMLSTLNEERVDEIIDQHGLPQATQHTITDRATLREDLSQVRKQGHSIEDEERREGIRAVGAPIKTDEWTSGALSISGPKSQLSESKIEDLQQQIRGSVNVIEIKLRDY